MRGILHHLIVAPILLPLTTVAVILFFDERKYLLKATISVISTVFLLCIAVTLIGLADANAPAANVYLVGNWSAPFGIVLVLDRLSALMLMLTSILAISALIFALARWHRAGPHFHTLFQFLLMGLNGAFLTGDLFNLFVFFEVMLAASYALILHGSGPRRVKAGLHYIVINLVASSFFLIGLSLIYGITGTLNIADLAARIPLVSLHDHMLFEVGVAILGIVFLIKAGMWPLNLCLPATYMAAAAPVTAIFVILSKVGIYVLLRLSFLFFGSGANTFLNFGREWVLFGGFATMSFGLIGLLASQAIGRLASYSILVASGTLLAAIGIGNPVIMGGALFYMISSTFTIAALFLLIELVERGQDVAVNVLAVTMASYGSEEEETVEEEVGMLIPATLAILGACFALCGILLIGLPPFSGFVTKFLLLAALFNPIGFGNSVPLPLTSWILVALIVLSSLSAMIAMVRTGIRTFWASLEGNVPRIRVIEIFPIASLLFLCIVLTIQAGPVMGYLDATAQSLHVPTGYIGSVFAAQPIHK